MNAWNENSDEKEIHFCACVCVCSATIMTLWRNDTLWSKALFRHNTCQNCARATLRDACANVLFHSIIIYTDLLVVYRESVNLIGYITRNKNLVLSNELIKPNFCFDLSHRRSTTVSLETRNSYITRRLSAGSLQLWIANKNRLFWARDACFTPQCTSRAVFETFELPM